MADKTSYMDVVKKSTLNDDECETEFETTVKVSSGLKEYTIIQFRRDSDDQNCDKYALELSRVGFENVYHIPVLKFEYRDSKVLKEHLFSDQYTGLVLTSIRAVKAVRRCFRSAEDFCKLWGKKQIYPIGPTTASEIEETLHFPLPCSPEAGNAERLAHIIVEKLQSKQTSEKLLIPCSSIANDCLPRILSQAGFDLCCIHVYDTKAVDDVSKQLSNILSEVTTQKVVFIFFSPSNLNAVCDDLRRHKDHERFLYAAIGPTTRTALESQGFPILCSSPRPNPISLAQELAKSLSSQ